jgi:hypothetical protein
LHAQKEAMLPSFVFVPFWKIRSITRALNSPGHSVSPLVVHKHKYTYNTTRPTLSSMGPLGYAETRYSVMTDGVHGRACLFSTSINISDLFSYCPYKTKTPNIIMASRVTLKASLKGVANAGRYRRHHTPTARLIPILRELAYRLRGSCQRMLSTEKDLASVPAFWATAPQLAPFRLDVATSADPSKSSSERRNNVVNFCTSK